MKNIKWLGHSTVKILGDKIIYIDPFEIKEDYKDADIIFITHSHYDHFSEEDIKKCMKDSTKIVITEDLYDKVVNLSFKPNDIIKVLPNNHYEVEKVNFNTVPAYNISKQFHPKENNWVGYIINMNNTSYYIAGDTDITEEAKQVECDIAFLPVGGKYTMNYEEASQLANIIEPELVIPIHYGSIIGTKEDAMKFKENIKAYIRCEIL